MNANEPAHPGERLPRWVTWQQRPFPDANLLYLDGTHPALADSGFVGHAEDTAALVHRRTPDLHLVVNTHWHSDHVGGNAVLQGGGAGIAASALDAAAINCRDPGCCSRSTSTNRSRRTPSTRLSTTEGSSTSATPTGRSSPPPDTPPATCACGSPRSADPGRGRRPLRLRRRPGQPRPRRPRRSHHRPGQPPAPDRRRPTRSAPCSRPGPGRHRCRPRHSATAYPAAGRRPCRSRLVRHPPHLRLRPDDPRRNRPQRGRALPARPRG